MTLTRMFANHPFDAAVFIGSIGETVAECELFP